MVRTRIVCSLAGRLWWQFLHEIQVLQHIYLSQSYIMLKILVSAIALITIIPTTLYFSAQPQSPYIPFSEYKKLYNLQFKNKFEETYRVIIYNQNVLEIQLHNTDNQQTYVMGINQFTYLTKQEFIDTYLGTKIINQKKHVDQKFIDVGELDWQAVGAVTPVKNQGNCGACWAFSATGALEGLSKISYNNLQSFSEQQLIDCSSAYGNNGCQGGNMEFSFKYVRANGITTQTVYPYKGVKGSCMYNSGNFKISSSNITPGCTALANSLLHGPVSIGVDASNWAPYKSGVFANCGGINLNHGVLVTGINNQYWRVKNSWGPLWGENGYIKLARGNTCGACIQPSRPNK